MRHIKLFSHSDLDGDGCRIVLNTWFPNDLVDTTTVANPNKASEAVLEFIEDKDYENYDHIFITDISISNEVAMLVEGLPSEHADKFTLLDHHITADYLNRYSWCKVIVKDTNGKTSGTSMLLSHLNEQSESYGGMLYGKSVLPEAQMMALKSFSETVRRYDSWEWHDVYNDTNPKLLNDLFFLVGPSQFTIKMIERILKCETTVIIEGFWKDMMTKEELFTLGAIQKQIDSYITRKSGQIREVEILGYRAGVVFADQYTSELGNILSECHPHLDFIAIVDMNTNKVSYRTIHKHIDIATNIAKNFGGGGHPQACGNSFDDALSTAFINVVFSQDVGAPFPTLKWGQSILGKGFKSLFNK